MSYQKIELTTIICDGCGEDFFENDEFCGAIDEENAELFFDESDWKKIDGKHYCPHCYEYDDDDNLIVRKKVKV